MHVSFRQLRLFLALADTGSVGGAARAMHVTQPTASMQLREVASAVGLPLYEVVSRRVRLTDSGLELARTARAMFGEWEAFGEKVAALQGIRRGRLRVAVVTTAQAFMPRLLGSFCALHPEVEVSLEVLNRDGVLGRLRERLDDLYIMSTPPAGADLQDQVFLPNPLVVLAPAGHALARGGPHPLRALAEERFILRERGSGTRMAVDQHFRQARFLPQVRLELGSNEAIRDSVRGRLGLAVLSMHALGDPPALDGLAVLDIQGFPLRSQWHVVRPRARVLTPVVQAFQAHLADAARLSRVRG
jgi:LysR family transcriptional regulator, low CO2-responsive transcriptional regulator